MATSRVLKITTRLTKDKFKKDLKGLTKDIKTAEAETNAMGEGAAAMSEGLGASVGAIAKIAVIAALVIGAFVLIKKAVDNIIAKNDSIRQRIEAIKNALSNIGSAIINVLSSYILPIVEAIINLIYKALSYINGITKAVWGYDLFAKKASDSLASGASSAKEIKKALAGFDTADILGSEDSGGGIGGIGGSEINTEGLQDLIKEKHLFKDMERDYNDMLESLKDKKAYKEAYGNWDWFVMGVVRTFAGLGQVIDGFKDTIVGLVKIVVGILTLNGEMISDGVIQLCDGIGKIVKGVVNIIWGLVVSLVGLIKGILLPIATWLWNNVLSPIWEFIKKVIGWIWDKITKVGSAISIAFSVLKGILIAPFEALWDIAKKVFDWISEKIQPLLDKVGALKDKLSAAADTVKSGASKVISGGSSLLKSVWNAGKGVFGLASGGIVNNPGPGVPLSQINVGEKGPEAVLPLTDGTLQRLANMIPVRIELTNTIDGRVLSRRLETIRQNSAFSRNGG